MLTPIPFDANDQAWKKSVVRNLHEEMKDDPKMAVVESHHLFVFNPLIDGQRQSFVSSIKHMAEQLMDGYEQCLEAQRISEKLSLDSTVVFFPDLEFIYLLQNVPHQVMTQYNDRLLYPLMHKDEDYVAEMLRTLESYFANGGQINDTAKSYTFIATRYYIDWRKLVSFYTSISKNRMIS